MKTHGFTSLPAARLAALGFVLAALAAGRAQPPPIPDAPPVPVAPSLPDAAIVPQPLTPAASQEIIEERPSAQHIWIAGHWRWQDGRYAWIAGHWDLPPLANAVWVEPRWDRRGNGFVLAGGYWQQAAAAPVVYGAPPAPPPGVAAPPSAPPTVVMIDQPPPPPQQEVILERPSPRHVWIGGFWAWRGGRHVWIGGHWELPPRERAEWVEPRWERRGNSYVFVDGFWRDAGVSVGVSIGVPGAGIVIREGPPPPRREFIDERHRPSRDAIWLAGYWRHDGHGYVWMSGRWEIPPRGFREWVEPRWENRGGAYVFVDGHWR